MRQRSRVAALLQLSSPSLPIGGFSYSQGLESAVEARIIYDAPTARRWIEHGLKILAENELPLLAHLWRYWIAQDNLLLREMNAWFLASRETFELRQETEQMGWSLSQLATSLLWHDKERREILAEIKPVGFPTVFAFAATALSLEIEECVEAYAFVWAENQVAASLKAVPLGQVAGQKILLAIHELAFLAAQSAVERPLEDISTFAPQLGILSARHETQYSRLFRS
jgi:urease accessory protein